MLDSLGVLLGEAGPGSLYLVIFTSLTLLRTADDQYTKILHVINVYTPSQLLPVEQLYCPLCPDIPVL